MGARSRLAWMAVVTGVVVGGRATPAGAHVYWANESTNTIGRANLDGSGANQSIITGGTTFPFGLTVDGQHLYWTTPSTNTIGRANLDGSGVDQSFITGASAPFALAVDGGPAGTASASATSVVFGHPAPRQPRPRDVADDHKHRTRQPRVDRCPRGDRRCR